MYRNTTYMLLKVLP